MICILKGGSGKSTVVKQMRILHGDQGLTPADRQVFGIITFVYSVIFVSFVIMDIIIITLSDQGLTDRQVTSFELPADLHHCQTYDRDIQKKMFNHQIILMQFSFSPGSRLHVPLKLPRLNGGGSSFATPLY